MTETSVDRRAAIESLAAQTGFSADAVASMWRSLVAGGGRMAQFDHREFGGPGQWMRGAMLMISDLFDEDLKRRVGRLCDALADAVDAGDAVPAPGQATQRQTLGDGYRTGARTGVSSPSEAARDAWYPASLGRPDSSGSQNAARYAWFAGPRRLAIDDGRGVTIHDTGDHRIGGVSQQQGASGTVSFVSQHGLVDVDRLPVVDADTPSPNVEDAVARTGESDPFVALEKLAGLHAPGIVDDAEYAAKKAELLARI